MNTLRVLVVFFVGLLAAPLFAFERGDVLFEIGSETPPTNAVSFDLRLYHDGWDYATAAGAWPLITKPVPFGGSGHFLMPAPDEIVFVDDAGNVGFWDGVYRAAWSDEPAYRVIFRMQAPASDLVRLRNGNYLVAERSVEAGTSAKLIEFRRTERVREIALPQLSDASGRTIGASHLFVMPDQCTLLYTTEDASTANRVRRMNICTQESLADFTTLPSGSSAGAIRMLPNGDVVVAGGDGVTEFEPNGQKVRLWYTPDAEYVALSADAKTAWVAGVTSGVAYLRAFSVTAPWEPARDITLANPGFQTSAVPVAMSDLVVVGEWQATMSVPRRERAVRH